MVLSVYDIDDYRSYFDVHPVRKIPNETNGYDCLLMGTRLGIGFIKGGQVVERPQFELDVKGRVRCVEMLTVSDAREKRCIELVPPKTCADLIKDMGVYRYEMGSKTQPVYGFVAQDVERIVESAVANDTDGKKAVNTVQLLALTVGALKDMQAQVAALRESVEFLLQQRPGGGAEENRDT